MVQAFGAPVALLGDALSFVVSALALRRVHVDEPQPGPRESVRRELTEGFRFLWHQPLLRAGVLCTSTVNLFNLMLFAIFVLYASRTLGLSAATIGLVLGAAAVGSLVGALVAPRVGIGRAVVIGSVLFPAPMVLFPLAHGSHWVSASMLFVGEFFAGIGVMIFDVNQNALITMLIPNEIRSRVGGVHRFFNYGVRPIGALLGGVLGAWIGLRATLWVSVLGSLLGVFFLLASPMPRTRETDLA